MNDATIVDPDRIAKGALVGDGARAADEFVDRMKLQWNFGLWEILIIERVRLLTFRIGAYAVRIPTLSHLTELTGIPLNKIGGVVDLLREKRVMNVTREGKRRGPQKAARPTRYALVVDQSLWNWKLIRPRFNLESAAKLEGWFSSRHPEDPEPNQPEVLPQEPCLRESLQETVVENFPRHVVQSGDGLPNRSAHSHLPDGNGVAGDDGNRRGSEQSRSIPDDPQVIGPPGLATRAAFDIQAQGADPLLPEKGSATSLKGRLWAQVEAQMDDPLKGKLERKPLETKDGNGVAPEKGSGDSENALRVSNVLGLLGKSSLGERKVYNPATSETLNTGGIQGGALQLHKKGSGAARVLPLPRAPGSKVSYATEDEFMRERGLRVLGAFYAAWGGWLRLRYRENPEVAAYAVDNLQLRLDNPKPVENRGRWLRNCYLRLMIEYKRLRRGASK